MRSKRSSCSVSDSEVGFIKYMAHLPEYLLTEAKSVPYNPFLMTWKKTIHVQPLHTLELYESGLRVYAFNKPREHTVPMLLGEVTKESLKACCWKNCHFVDEPSYIMSEFMCNKCMGCTLRFGCLKMRPVLRSVKS
jgi:hypothetical protein